MTFNPNIPQANDDPSVSQAQLLANFGVLNTDFAVNHNPLTATANPGFHTKVFFANVLGADPGLSAPQSSLYTKTVSAANQLFFQNGALASNVFQLTNLPVVTTGTNYSVVTPWGLIIKMGQANASPINFADAIANPLNTVYTALLTPRNSFTTFFITAVNPTNLTYNGFVPVYYLAIGTK